MKIVKQFYSYTQGKHVEDTLFSSLNLAEARQYLNNMKQSYIDGEKANYPIKSYSDMFTIKHDLDLVIYQIIPENRNENYLRKD